MELYFSRIQLAKNPSARALASLLRPAGENRRISAQHNLIWSAFADHADRQRDFLWREENDGSFLTLSSRPPVQTDLFQPHQVKFYAPDLTSGDRLDFQLRVNATRAKKSGSSRGKREDVVKASIDALEQCDRAERRMEIATTEGAAWLERQGEKSGFRVVNAVAEDYRTLSLPRHGKSCQNKMTLGVLDLTGRIEITNPASFLSQMAQGFGRAKAFGCGLMLIRRSR